MSTNDQKIDADVLKAMTANSPLKVVKAADGTKSQPGPGKLSDAEFSKLTPAQKLDYARSHDQTQFQNPIQR